MGRNTKRIKHCEEWILNHQGIPNMCQEEQKAEQKLDWMSLAHDSVPSSSSCPFLKKKYSVGGIIMRCSERHKS